ISIITNRLPKEQQPKGRFIGLSLAMIFRILLLMGIAYIITLTKPLFVIFEHEVSTRDLILLAGGLFLIAKTTSEIHGKVSGLEMKKTVVKVSSFASVIFQIVMIDIIFSFDSILTA